MSGRLIEAVKAPIRRRWPRMRLRTILLVTFLFVAALPGAGALFLRVYENTLVRQTEAELIAQSAALAAIASAEWPGSRGVMMAAQPRGASDPYAVAGGELSTIDLRTSPVLTERPAPVFLAGSASPEMRLAAMGIAPILRATADTTLASILLLDGDGRVLVGANAGRGYPGLPEVAAAHAGRAETVLRHNGAYRRRYAGEWLSRASSLRIHHARPVLVNGRVVAILLLSRSPRALFRGLYEDRGKILFGIGAIFVTLVVLSGLLSRGIVRPIEALSEATRSVARGGGSVPAASSTAATEIQALYADFAVMSDAIERRSGYLRDFAYAVSHEFKTPLTGIRGAIELLVDHPEMAAVDRVRFLANADADAGRLALLVSRLLDLARADMTVPEHGARVDLAAIVARLADAYRSAGFAVENEVPQAVPPVAVPAATMEAVLAVLIVNSRQAGAGRIRIVATSDGARVSLAVSDDGPGIAPADRVRLFEPFFTTRRTEGGTGLGLAIARSLLTAAGATITLSSGKATTFLIDLPKGAA